MSYLIFRCSLVLLFVFFATGAEELVLKVKDLIMIDGSAHRYVQQN
jgi:hypothetical protein